jgi:hypothetical protein
VSVRLGNSQIRLSSACAQQRGDPGAVGSPAVGDLGQLGLAGWLGVERDKLDEAHDTLARVADRVRLGSKSVRFLAARGRLRVVPGAARGGALGLLGCERRCARLGIVTAAAVQWRGEAALVYAALGEAREARRLAGEQ